MDKLIDEMNDDEVTIEFIKKFNTLPILFEFNGFELRDLSQLNEEDEIFSRFKFIYGEDLFDWLQKMQENYRVLDDIEVKCGHFALMDKNKIIDTLAESLNIEDSEYDYYSNDLFLKFPKETKELLKSNYCIIEQYYTYWKENLFEGVSSKSFFITWFAKEFSFEWRDWKEIENILENNKS